jgi:hypothetical protein
MSCPERDRIILAFAFAMNNTNNGYTKLELARSETERRNAREAIETSQDHCYHLRNLVLRHCESHGC